MIISPPLLAQRSQTVKASGFYVPITLGNVILLYNNMIHFFKYHLYCYVSFTFYMRCRTAVFCCVGFLFRTFCGAVLGNVMVEFLHD